ncbi:MAG: hypothetical protein RB191_22960 [Terriglobia bacterium]|nr:hypothetical protein [Terriglobia bacterium]
MSRRICISSCDIADMSCVRCAAWLVLRRDSGGETVGVVAAAALSEENETCVQGVVTHQSLSAETKLTTTMTRMMMMMMKLAQASHECHCS